MSLYDKEPIKSLLEAEEARCGDLISEADKEILDSCDTSGVTLQLFNQIKEFADSDEKYYGLELTCNDCKRLVESLKSMFPIRG